jgi:serine/threonine protein kinase
VVYTDFGISYDYSLLSQSTTIGHPIAFTRRYCAPEVADWTPRNRKADIFSLGCVFLEILQVLGLLSDHVVDGTIHENTALIQESLESLSLLFAFEQVEDTEASIRSALPQIAMMLNANPEGKPSAKTVVFAFRDSNISNIFFCPTCDEILSNRKHKKHTTDHKLEQLTPPLPVFEDGENSLAPPPTTEKKIMWPQPIQNYVQHSFAPESQIPGIKRSEMEARPTKELLKVSMMNMNYITLSPAPLSQHQ